MSFENNLAEYLEGRDRREQVQWLREHGVEAAMHWRQPQLNRAIADVMSRMPSAVAEREKAGAVG